MPPSTTNGLIILDSTSSIPGSALSTIPEHTYSFFIHKFFEHVGAEYSPLISALSFNSIGSIIREVKPICSAISALGAKCASKDVQNFNSEARNEFAAISNRSYKEAYNDMQLMWNTRSQSANHVLLCALLLSIFEVCFDIILLPTFVKRCLTKCV